MNYFLLTSMQNNTRISYKDAGPGLKPGDLNRQLLTTKTFFLSWRFGLESYSTSPSAIIEHQRKRGLNESKQIVN
jgi:hypothetical protein